MRVQRELSNGQQRSQRAISSQWPERCEARRGAHRVRFNALPSDGCRSPSSPCSNRSGRDLERGGGGVGTVVRNSAGHGSGRGDECAVAVAWCLLSLCAYTTPALDDGRQRWVAGSLRARRAAERRAERTAGRDRRASLDSTPLPAAGDQHRAESEAATPTAMLLRARVAALLLLCSALHPRRGDPRVCVAVRFAVSRLPPPPPFAVVVCSHRAVLSSCRSAACSDVPTAAATAPTRTASSSNSDRCERQCSSACSCGCNIRSDDARGGSRLDASHTRSSRDALVSHRTRSANDSSFSS